MKTELMLTYVQDAPIDAVATVGQTPTGAEAMIEEIAALAYKRGTLRYMLHASASGAVVDVELLASGQVIAVIAGVNLSAGANGGQALVDVANVGGGAFLTARVNVKTAASAGATVSGVVLLDVAYMSAARC